MIEEETNSNTGFKYISHTTTSRGTCAYYVNIGSGYGRRNKWFSYGTCKTGTREQAFTKAILWRDEMI